MDTVSPFKSKTKLEVSSLCSECLGKLQCRNSEQLKLVEKHSKPHCLNLIFMKFKQLSTEKHLERLKFHKIVTIYMPCF